MVPEVPEGAVVHGSTLGLLPAAATTGTPSASTEAILVSNDDGRPENPMLMFTMAF